MNEFELLVRLHQAGDRQGPGDQAQTKRAMELAGLFNRPTQLKIADIGCGTGASTLVLAEHLGASIIAVDLFPAFLNILHQKAEDAGVAHQIQTLSCSMDDLPFDAASLDVIWSEGAIYNMGFKAGIAYFKQFLKPEGILAVSELTWLTSNRPDELTAHWQKEYPEVDTVSEKIKILEAEGLMLLGYFPLPANCWLENYYIPLQSRFADFLNQQDSELTQSIVENERKEIELYKAYCNYYSYGFYIAKKL
ncbi:MAG: class I SAM-dependent methyltransferase [Spirulina sp. SIO3F2]|nr:class I SAM-dependent methyltransferase [Spirulina sp. SIO3F2]